MKDRLAHIAKRGATKQNMRAIRIGFRFLRAKPKAIANRARYQIELYPANQLNTKLKLVLNKVKRSGACTYCPTETRNLSRFGNSIANGGNTAAAITAMIGHAERQRCHGSCEMPTSTQVPNNINIGNFTIAKSLRLLWRNGAIMVL